ncbi:MAG: DUF3488 domain-containing protein [Acidobacteria bacterium]|nr:MAG: DUF3488 domain-containing protein [Acidobacteriota bacterium]
MNFERLFRISSYGVATSGLLSLLVTGGVSPLLAIIFLIAFIVAWHIEDTRWQLSERAALILILICLPLFYLDWRYHLGFFTRETAAAASLSKLILTLATIKLLQRKSNRDWFFIYMISFFEILLSAGLSITPLFTVSLILYLLMTICAIISFEIKRSIENLSSTSEVKIPKGFAFKLFRISAFILITIFFVAIPVFFMIPRFGGAGIGAGLTEGVVTGFSDSIRLGQIARIQQRDDIVMRVRIENNSRPIDIKWRGVALDYFDKLNWYKTRKSYSEPFVKTDSDFFVVDGADEATDLVTQTIYLEPLDTPVLFVLWRPVAIQGAFKLINKDAEGSISVARSGTERFSYKVFSDISTPKIEDLRSDNSPYSFQHSRYLQLPDYMDPRISFLAEKVIKEANASTRYDKAQAIERYLQENFGYTLDLKVGGSDPLADFLFNVREGHCEYFATAMAIMLRTQGIATRVVTGFQSGEYNETAQMYIVRQRNAHAWVEVYFPGENTWIAFDPTPSAGRNNQASSNYAIIGRVHNYLEALEAIWVQYVIAYDNQEQKSLLTNVQSSLRSTQGKIDSWILFLRYQLSDWWENISGQRGLRASLKTALKSLLYVCFAVIFMFGLRLLLRKLDILNLLLRLKHRLFGAYNASIVDFYDRTLELLEKNGFWRDSSQTPLEFALSTGIPEVVKITEKYNEVRFGNRKLSETDRRWIEKWIKTLENKLRERKDLQDVENHKQRKSQDKTSASR